MADPGIKLTKKEIAAAFGNEAAGGPPQILTTKQAHELLQIPRSTFFQWKAQGVFAGCFRRHGKCTRWWRDRLVEAFFNKHLD